MRKLYLLSASDRFNYGDLLFPIVATHQLAGDFDIVNTALLQSSHTECGALSTQPYRSLFVPQKPIAGEKRPILLIAGGEVLGAEWVRLLSFCLPKFRSVFDIITSRRLTYRCFENFVRWTFGHGEPLPFVPTHSIVARNYDIAFHAVGGSDIHESPHCKAVKATFDRAVYLSARECDTYSSIKKHMGCENVLLTPDSAILMSDCFQPELTNDGSYICFQMRNMSDTALLHVIKHQLEMLSAQTGKRIVLLAIGNCPGHDDEVSLRWLEGALTCPRVLIVPSTITEIMATIANASLFIGTSLHGIITAMSFDVPYVGLDPSIAKISAYLRTWAAEGLSIAVPFSELLIAGKNAITTSKTKLRVNADMQKQRARDSFKNMRSQFMGARDMRKSQDRPDILSESY